MPRQGTQPENPAGNPANLFKLNRIITLETRRAAGGEFNMNHLNQEEFPSMCFGVHKKSTGENSNYAMMENYGLKEIHHVDLSATMFSRVYCEQGCIRLMIYRTYIHRQI